MASELRLSKKCLELITHALLIQSGELSELVEDQPLIEAEQLHAYEAWLGEAGALELLDAPIKRPAGVFSRSDHRQEDMTCRLLIFRNGDHQGWSTFFRLTIAKRKGNADDRITWK